MLILVLMACLIDDKRACREFVDVRNACFTGEPANLEPLTYEQDCTPRPAAPRTTYDCLIEVYANADCSTDAGIDQALAEADECPGGAD